MGALDTQELSGYVALGELSLSAEIRSVSGVLPAAIHAASKGKGLICPKACGAEAAWAGDLEILAPSSLLSLMNHFKGAQVLKTPEAKLADVDDRPKKGADLADVKGQETAKRALEIAASGGHNMLMIGPPGSGKSMLASCLPGILPPLDPKEALEVSMVHSLSGTLPEDGLLKTRPFRDPHHSASLPALVGGGQKATPGEISLAHHGVLFLDEFPEFQRAALEALRQPLETGEVLVSRVNYHATYPARVQLVAAMNPCRCGYLGSGTRECTKAPRCGSDYQSKISGPMFDRIDVTVEVPAVQVSDLMAGGKGESSAVVAARVAHVRKLQAERAVKMGFKARLNAHLQGEELEALTQMDEKAAEMMARAAEKLNLSARAYHRVLRLARTISDMSLKENENSLLTGADVAEALSLRLKTY
jgi:magnesium chelatase family protein